MRVIMRLVLLLVLFNWAKCASSEECPAAYQRFSKTHTFCLKPNPKCDIKFSGVSNKEKDLIVELHNRFRNVVATGKETRAIGGALPEAADILQMVWDDELGAIAQKWTDNCVYKHDCRDGCRMVESFQLGQNLARYEYSCPSKGCTEEKENEFVEPNWEYPIEHLYEEVLNYKKKWVDNYEGQSDDTGHFTQLVWSKSWRIGCGYTAYKEGGTYYKYYACNYGPAGNVKKQPMYKKGKPCSACPVNTCCGETCGEKVDYPGLCKMLDPDTAPIYPRETDNLLFFCDTLPTTKDCATQVNGTETWKNVVTLAGNYDSIELKGGQATVVKFKKEITPTESAFCVRVIYRKSPLKAEEKDDSVAGVEVITANKVTFKSLKTSPRQFRSYQVNLGWNKPSKIALHYSVPSGGKPHIFDVKEIIVYNGKCSKAA